MMAGKSKESGTVVAFEVGDCVMHRASGERAIVTRVNHSDGTLHLSLGLDDSERRLGALVVPQFLVERTDREIGNQLEARYGDLLYLDSDGKVLHVIKTQQTSDPSAASAKTAS